MTRFAAVVTDKGELRLLDPTAWRVRLTKLRGRHVWLVVERQEKKRSLNQNAWYWAAIVPAVQQHLSEARTLPLTKEQTHYVLASAFVGTEDTPLGPVPCKTSTLTTEQFSTYCERIRAHAAAEWGLPIPGPDDPGVWL